MIGIVSQPIPWDNLKDTGNYSYIATSYVRTLESSGARVVSINYKLDFEAIKDLMNQLNGILFTGGKATLLRVTNKN